MIAIRKAWWAGVLLAAFAGCNSEEPQGANPLPPPPTGPSNTGPALEPTPAKTDETKPAPAGEAAKPEPPKDEAKDKSEAPKEKEAPKDVPKVEAPATTPEPAKPEAPKEEKKAEAAPKAALNAEELDAIKQLPKDEQALAIKQIVCPVSGENLGSMDKPIKVSAEGKTFFLCCKGCEKDVKSDPKAVIAKLNLK